MALILDGKKIQDIRAETLGAEIAKLSPKPKLVIFQVGDLDESNVYIQYKKKFAEKIGALVEHKKYLEKISEKFLLDEIAKANSDKTVHGIIVQIPLPIGFNEDKILEAVTPEKDIDGLTGTNTKLLMNNRKGIMPATTRGILDLLSFYEIPYRGKKMVMVGSSALVGIPTAQAFLNGGAKVTICDEKTKNLENETKNADIIVVAVGKTNLITSSHVSKGQIIVDVGINVISAKNDTSGILKRKVVGDVNFEEAEKIVTAITPVPGGVGPMTVLALFENLLDAYKNLVDHS